MSYGHMEYRVIKFGDKLESEVKNMVGMMGWGVEDQGWRKGPWTPKEDKLLTDHVNLHGEGRWSSLAKSAGLNRSGKSCRLRWVNYLRPGLKRGQFTPHEEAIIVELHALWGNKWSTIARYLPGRTDNEIKNYWRTHFKKRDKSCLKPKKQKPQQKQKQQQREGMQIQLREESMKRVPSEPSDLEMLSAEAQGRQDLQVLMYPAMEAAAAAAAWFQEPEEQCVPLMFQEAASWTSDHSVVVEGLCAGGLWNLDDDDDPHGCGTSHTSASCDKTVAMQNQATTGFSHEWDSSCSLFCNGGYIF